MRNLYLTILLFGVTLLQSCTRDPLQNEDFGNKSALNIKLNTKALELAGTSVQTVRIIAYHKGKQKIILNTTGLTDNSVTSGEGMFTISIPTGEYSFYAIVNELTDLTADLQSITSPDDLNLIKIQPAAPFSESDVMLSKQVDATITVDANDKVLVGGADTPLSIELERVYTKVSLKITKNTLQAADKFTITKVEFVQSPEYSFLNSKIYDGATFVSRDLFAGSEEFETNNTSKQIVKEITTASEPSNIFAEYILADANKEDHDKAAYFGIYAQYIPSGGTTAHEVFYKVPVGDYNGKYAVDQAGRDYNLKRNMHYAFDVKITKMGKKDATDIAYTVKPWDTENVDVSTDVDPFIDVSNVEVDVYDAAATRIYFYSNIEFVRLNPKLLNGTQLDDVDALFEDLIGDESTNYETKNFKYSYNPDTKRGEGYFDLLNLHTDNVVSAKRLLYLKSDKLVREITATTRISSEAAEKNPQPYVGTFHRSSERSERIISWHLPKDTYWKVEVLTPANKAKDNVTANDRVYEDAEHLRIDRLASPNHAKLYTLDPLDPEGSYVTQDASITTLEGRDRIYFRVGWASTIGYSEHRFAKIKVTTSTTGDFLTDPKEIFLYCRQGEDPVPILSNTTVFSCYNIFTPEVFVDYPTKTGYLYQWNRTQPWAVTGIVNNYIEGVPPADWSTSVPPKYEYKTYSEQTYVCPAKYSYPDQEAIDVMNGALRGAMYNWGYYADGFFDRRAIKDHTVRGVLGEVASAGGLFFSAQTGVAILLPSASWRDYLGKINNVGHQQLGLIGHYWSSVKGISTSADSYPDAHAQALHLTTTTTGTTNSYIENLNKASAANVRCMRLDGQTVYFDANGGISTPRSITQKSGEVTFPAGPARRDIRVFTKWTATRGGVGESYDAGDKADISVVGNKTWYAQYIKGYQVGSDIMIVSDIKTNVTWAQAEDYCNTTLNAGSSTSNWKLPTSDQALGLIGLETALFPSGTVYWTSTPDTAGKHKALIPNFTPIATGVDDNASHSVRCVKVNI